MSVEDILKELQDIQEHPEVLLDVDSEMETVLKKIIKIERRHLYGLDSTSVTKRRSAIQELLIDNLKNKVG